MHIILLILKILGIALLAILLLLLLILICLLVVPIRYRLAAEVTTQEDGAIEPNVRATVSWLLHLVHVSVVFAKENGLAIVIRAAGIPVKRIGKDGQSSSEETEAENAEAEKAEPEKADTVKEAENAEPEKTDTVKAEPDNAAPEHDGQEMAEALGEASGQKPETAKSSQEQPAEVQKTENELKQEEPAKESQTEEPAEDAKEKGSFFEKLEKKVEAGKETAEAMLALFSRKKGLAIAYYQKASTQAAIAAVLKCVKWLLLHIAPKDFRGNVLFGSGDPMLTGQIFAGAAVVYPYFGEYVEAVPDFDRKVIEGDVSFHGRIRLGSILVRAIRLYFNKNLRRVIAEANRVKDKMMKTPQEVKDILAANKEAAAE